ncbi:cAMP receptor protein [mine drainage metagenome]|uniref:cAMP receptor protein n=1 Tax=mine drainage metagenome TaxID=410659 RepID=A0A1J5T5Q7_9ZZZZ
MSQALKKERGMAGKVVYDRLVLFPGDEVFAEGDRGNWAYLVQAGQVAIVKRTPAGEEVVLGVLGPGRLFGEMALIDDQPRMATARALTSCQLILIDRYTFNSKLQKSDPLVRELLQNLTNNLRAITSRTLPALAGGQDEMVKP